jgi:endonuclease YncB( thermonuclease family)
MTRRPIEFAEFPVAIKPEYGPYAAICRHVVDGDTADFLVSCGFGIYPYITVRLLGIDAPETNRAESKEAGIAARERLKELLPPGEPVELWTRPDPDSFGRYLATIATEYEDDIGALLLREGFAVPYVR